MKQTVWLEAAINGAAGRTLQPRIPIAPDEIVADAVACAEAGAAIIHLHVYDPNGTPVEDSDLYARIIEGVRKACDAIVYPTLALKGDREARLAPIRELARRGLLEWGVVDPGSVNITHRLQAAAGMDGVNNELDPGAPNNDNLYDYSQAQLDAAGISVLPQNLHEALVALEKDDVIRAALGPVVDEFLRLKHMEWVEYMRHVSDWEVNSYLEFF